MISQTTSLNRRHFLKGVGATLALPAMESVLPSGLAAAEGSAPLATTASGAPLRMAYIYFPNGVIAEKWNPKGEGADYQHNITTQSLEPHRDQIQMISGGEHHHGWSNGDGGGDHARATSTFLTGTRAHKTAGADIHLGVSADQVAADRAGDLTRFSSLELSCDGVRKAGRCDSGYSCAYQYNISWRSETTPMTPEANPRLVFERLFGEGNSVEERRHNFAARNAQQKSVLDFIIDDAARLKKQLGRNDQMKLDEYLTGVREIEQRIEKSEKFGDLPEIKAAVPEEGIPATYKEHIRLMYDLLALAFETDSTRVATFLLAHDGSNRTFSDIGVPEGHHSLSHHRRTRWKMDKLAKIDKFYAEQFAYFLEQLSKKKDADGKSVLHNSMIVYGGGLKDADRHQHDDLPVILAGHGGGALKPGRHLRLKDDTPMTNLYLTMLEKFGAKPERIGDSTGTLSVL